jgi:hypothetical protein
MFVMVCLTYYMAIIPTMWIFWFPVCRPVQKYRPSVDSYDDVSRDIEIMNATVHPDSEVTINDD